MNRIIILGGGTAGWMAASLLNKTLAKKNINITLIESPQIGIIGVGEGSTPQLGKLFAALDIAESEWMAACDATFKNGISFVNWTEHTHNNRYFHPFPSPFDRQTVPAFLYHNKLRLQGMDVPVKPDEFFLSAKLAELNLSPKPKPNKPQIPLNYAYHFDSAKLGEFLAAKAVSAGVVHIQDQLSDAKDAITFDAHGNITTLKMRSGEHYSADLFIDCTGFSSLLLQEALSVPFTSFNNNLFNDAAVAIPTKAMNPLPSETRATALKYGWAWHIPLTKRTGNGYVYSSKYISAEEAENELLNALGFKTKADYESANPNLPPIKHLSMKVGQVKEHWRKNVVAVGLSQGFIEPLEATALHLVQESIMAFLERIDDPNVSDKIGFTADKRESFNQEISARFNGIRDYIVAHYKMNTRSDSQYWLDNSKNQGISERLEAVLQCWQSGEDISPVLEHHNMTKYYPAISWYCLLSGYGAFDKATTENRLPPHAMRQMQAYIQTNTEHFETHDKAL